MFVARVRRTRLLFGSRRRRTMIEFRSQQTDDAVGPEPPAERNNDRAVVAGRLEPGLRRRLQRVLRSDGREAEPRETNHLPRVGAFVQRCGGLGVRR